MARASGLLVLAAATHAAVVAPSNPWAGNVTIQAELMRLSDWIMTTDVGSNVLKNVSKTTNTSIFINGDLARVLLASSKIAARSASLAPRASAYLAEGLRWCDSLVALQIPIKTSSGAMGGFWNTGYNEIFIADTGTAVTALALCATMQQNATKSAEYEDALGKFALFVTEGCSAPPTTICTDNPFPGCKSNMSKVLGTHPACPGGSGWVIEGGKNKGGLGDGWYKSMLNIDPYTISTATTGSCGMVEAAALPNVERFFPPGAAKLKSVAQAAVRWLLDSRASDGRIPYIISPWDNSSVVFQPITYSTESMIICDLLYPEMRAELASLKSTVHWLVANQNADGSWGASGKALQSSSFTTDTVQGEMHVEFSPSGDAQRSPRALSLLQWYVSRVDPTDKSVMIAIGKYLDFILNPAKSKNFGVAQSRGASESPLVTGFVGLALADLVMPWSTFNPLK